MSTPENANDGCVGPQSEQAGKAASCEGCPNQQACASGKAKERDPAMDDISARMSDIKHKILVLSGKGGVGKSTVASQLSWTLSTLDLQVGVLDIDICGPSIPRMLGVENEEVHHSNLGWSPVYVNDNLSCMSVAFMLSSKNDAIIWRGPRKNGLIKQFLTDVNWENLDFLIVDAPPGTSDEHISITQYLQESNIDGAVIVTTPQEVSLLDVRKEITFCQKTNIPIIGVVENMCEFICECGKKTCIFPPVSGGARQMCEEMNVPFLGSIPIDPRLLICCESGKCYVQEHPNGTAVSSLKDIVKKVLQSSETLKQTGANAINQLESSAASMETSN